MRPVLVLAAAFVAQSLGAAVPVEHDGPGYFSLKAEPKMKEKRDFLSDWRAAHNRWAKNQDVPGSMMALQGGKFGQCPLV